MRCVIPTRLEGSKTLLRLKIDTRQVVLALHGRFGVFNVVVSIRRA